MKSVLSGTSKKFKKAVSLVLGLCMVCALTMGFGAKPVMASGLKISVMGDSISSYYNPGGYHSNNVVSNDGDYYPRYDVNDVNKTWWMQSVNQLQGQILSVDAIGGSCVADYSHYNDTKYHTGPDYCFVNAARNWSRLGDLGEVAGSSNCPNLVILFGGTNDACQSNFDQQVFANSYSTLINQINIRYGNPTILCITPFSGALMKQHPNNFQQVCNQIKHVAGLYGNCKVVDLSYLDFQAFSPAAEYSDGHPNSYGMALIASRVVQVYNNN